MIRFWYLLFLIYLFGSKIWSKAGKFTSIDESYILDYKLSNSDNGEYRRNLITRGPPQNGLEYTRLHKCKNGGEAYSASYLITKEHLSYQFTDYNLSWVNCEMGSFIMFGRNPNPLKNVNGTLVQSLDVLDFSVVHLSTYERLQKRWGQSIRSDEVRLGKIDPIINTAKILKQRALRLQKLTMPKKSLHLNRTVVIMPFLGGDMGAGHSKLSNRFQYLSACFWSFYADYPYIVAGVKTQGDYDFARSASGLPFFDVLLINNLPKSASLPVATVQQTKARILDGRWDFDYIFFTESDQLLMMKIPDDVYTYLNQYPRHLLIPHRLMAYPRQVITLFHKRKISRRRPYDWLDMSCCLPRQHCEDRKNWIHISKDNVSILNIYGIQVPLGNSNFHAETYRTCKLDLIGGIDECP